LVTDYSEESTMSFNGDELEQPQTDQGVPVGGADVEQDRVNAGGDEDSTLADGDWAQEGAAAEGTDQGVPVGAADVDEDRRNAGGSDASGG
jgi:hypothetical protein